MFATGKPYRGHASPKNAHHHRLDHREREQRRDRRIDGIATSGEHFRPGDRAERMIGHHHPPPTSGGLLANCERGGHHRTVAQARRRCERGEVYPDH